MDATKVTDHLALVFQFGCSRALCPVGSLAVAFEVLVAACGI